LERLTVWEEIEAKFVEELNPLVVSAVGVSERCVNVLIREAGEVT
jgi:hypothetical protein